MTPGEHDAAAARAAARAILDAPPFVAPRRPSGLFERISTDVGHWIATAVGWVVHQFDRLFAHPVNDGARSLFGGWSPLVLAILGALVVAGVATAVIVRRQHDNPTAGAPEPGVRERRAARAARLLDEATTARRAGDLDAALRLRFAAGLERLEDRGLLHDRASLTTTTLASQLASTTFDELASVHSLVAYGGVTASADDVEFAFSSWPRVADEAGRSAVVS
ncbi:MAG TPA: hypothetical protein VMQ40_04680 [Acidimicrobiales bacterium]|jgi:hypothetical protein|nr:hypothetical protein [Acidimicrobiales bacterium]